MSRSYLLVAADAGSALPAALDQGADAVVVDLVVADPAASRAAVARLLADAPASARVFVRINPGPVGHEDARELVAGPDSALAGLWVARTESAVQLDALDAVLSIVEGERGVPARSVLVIPSLESAAAMLAAAAIARAPRVLRLHLAEQELCLELGVEPSADERELSWHRAQVVVAGAAAGLLPPIGGPPSIVDSAEHLLESTEGLRRAGFGGRLCLDPAQLSAIAEVFRPAPAGPATATYHMLFAR